MKLTYSNLALKFSQIDLANGFASLPSTPKLHHFETPYKGGAWLVWNIRGTNKRFKQKELVSYINENNVVPRLVRNQS